MIPAEQHLHSVGEQQKQETRDGFWVVRGTSTEVVSLNRLIGLFQLFPSGRNLYKEVVCQYKNMPHFLEYNPKLKIFGKYQVGLNLIELKPFSEDVQYKFRTKDAYDSYMIAVLGHELMHVKTAGLYVKMIQNASTFQDVLLTMLLSEAASHLVEKRLLDEIHSKEVICNDSFSQNEYLTRILQGYDWADIYIKNQMTFYTEAKNQIQKNRQGTVSDREIIVVMQKNRYPMPVTTSEEMFNQGVSEFLNIIGSDLAVSEVRNIHIPEKKYFHFGLFPRLKNLLFKHGAKNVK